MLEINPVLAGTFDQPGYAPAVTNLPQNSATEDANGVDARRYTQFDRSAADSGTADFSFSDFLDLVNPLQHIPVISAAYRAITGDKINPVSQVAGDIMYGGALGGASAIMGGAGAIGDTLIQAQTGKSAIAYVADALFGSDEDAKTQTASAAAAPAAASAVLPASVASTAVPAASPLPASSTPLPAGQAGLPLASAKSFPLAGNKMPYGGVMDMGNKMQAQDMAIALSAASPAMRLGNTVYTGRLMTGAHPTPGPAQPAANIQATQSGSGDAGADAKNQLPQGLVDDIMALKALNQYKNTAAAPPAPGSMVNTTN